MCFSIFASCALFTNVATVKADKTSFETVDAISIYTPADVEKGLGIRYELRMESEEYNTFMSNEQISNVEFGAFIVPEDYATSKGEFTIANLFTNPVYYWGDVEEEYKVGKTEILNLSTNELPKVADGYNSIYASIIDIKPENVSRVFVGVGYVKYTETIDDEATVKYILDDCSAKYSIAELAKRAIDEEIVTEEVQLTNLQSILNIKTPVRVSATCGSEKVDASAIKSAIASASYKMGETLDIANLIKPYVPVGYEIDAEESVLSAEIPFRGYATFNVAYKALENSTGNLVYALKPQGLASSYLKDGNSGELFNYGEENHLYFNCKNSNYANRILFNTEFIEQLFENGYVNLKVKFYVSSFDNSAWVKIGPYRYDAANESFKELSARANTPALNTSYDEMNKIEITWEISAEELATFDFANGDTLAIGGLGAGSVKSQVVFTHIEFIKP